MSDQENIPAPEEPTLPEIESDETIPPRPEEEIADEARAKPDIDGDAGAELSPNLEV